MGGFLAELRRRHIFRIGGVYVVAAWGVAQVVDLLSQTYALPDWIAQPLLAVLAIGLPFTLLAAWMIVGAAKAGETPVELKKATATDWALLAGFAVVIVLIGYQRMSLTEVPSSVTAVSNSAAASVASNIVEQVTNRLPNSVAVLPFDNVSPDPDDAYFAIGVHDEILNKLSKIRSLNVIARGSVMQYADTDSPIPQISQELNVEMVMTGTVRYAGDQVRVTAQLIDGMTNLPVWTTEDDGDLSDIFAIQSDIAMNIANSLQAQFSVEEQASVEAQPTSSPEAYALYLKSYDIFLSSPRADNASRLLMIDLLDQAIEIDPNFALAYVARAATYRLAREFQPVVREDWLRFNSEMNELRARNLEMALSIDPTLSEIYAERASLRIDNNQVDLALQDIALAYRLNPNSIDVQQSRIWIAAIYTGDYEEAVDAAEWVIARDSQNSNNYIGLGDSLHFLGRHEEAIATFERCAAISPARAVCRRGMLPPLLASGDQVRAVETLRETEQLAGLDTPSTTIYLLYGYGLAGQSDDAARVFDALKAVDENIDYVDPGQWAWAYLGIRDFDNAKEQINRALEQPELQRRQDFLYWIAYNYWFDPQLEEPDWVELRNRIRSR